MGGAWRSAIGAGRRIACLLAALCLALPLCSFAEAAEKQEASPACIPSIFTDTIYTAEPARSAVATPLLFASPDAQEREPLTACRITQTAGDPAFGALYVYFPASGTILLNPAGLPETGSTAFHVEMESEHYRLRFDVRPVFAGAKEAAVRTGGEILEVPLGREMDVGAVLLGSGFLTAENALAGFTLYTADLQRQADTGAYTLGPGGRTLIFREAGDYAFTLIALLGANRTEIRVPVLFRAAGDGETAVLSGRPHAYLASGASVPLEETGETGEGAALAVQAPGRTVTPEVFTASAWEEKRQGLFTVPVPEGFQLQDSGAEEWENGLDQWSLYADAAENNYVYISELSLKDVWTEDPEAALDVYQEAVSALTGEVLWHGQVLLDGGHPAYAVALSRVVSRGQEGLLSHEVTVRLWYLRGSSFLRLSYEMYSPASAAPDDSVRPGSEDFAPLLAGISWSVPEDAQVPDWLLTPAGFTGTVSSEGDRRVVQAGKTLALSHRFRDQELIDAKPGDLGEVLWSVADTAAYESTGDTTPVAPGIATVSAEGVLRAGAVAQQTRVTVLAQSRAAGTVAALNLILLPKQGSLAIREGNLLLYEGQSGERVLTAQAEPADSLLLTADFTPLVWSLDREGVLSLEDRGDGTAVIRPLARGQTVVSVQDTLSGWIASATVTVGIPATGVTIDGPDRVRIGKVADYASAVSPMDATNKKVAWSLDVGEEIATISAEGRLYVKGNTPAGTAIRILCRALGCEAPCEAEKTVTVISVEEE